MKYKIKLNINRRIISNLRHKSKHLFKANNKNKFLNNIQMILKLYLIKKYRMTNKLIKIKLFQNNIKLIKINY